MDNTAAALTKPLRELDARYALDKNLLAQELGLTRKQVQRVFDGDTDRLSHVLAVADKLGYVFLAVARPAAPVIAPGHEVTAEAADLIALAARVLGGTRQAQAWLHQPQLALDGQVPAQQAGTPQGAEQVRALLLRLECGVYT